MVWKTGYTLAVVLVQAMLPVGRMTDAAEPPRALEAGRTEESFLSRLNPFRSAPAGLPRYSEVTTSAGALPATPLPAVTRRYYDPRRGLFRPSYSVGGGPSLPAPLQRLLGPLMEPVDGPQTYSRQRIEPMPNVPVQEVGQPGGWSLIPDWLRPTPRASVGPATPAAGAIGTPLP